MKERAQNADFHRKPRIFADSTLLLEVHAIGGRRKLQIFTENFRRKLQETSDWGSVTLIRHLQLLSGPLNAILSLLQPLDRLGPLTPSAIASAIGRPSLALSRIHAQAGVLNRLVLNRF